MQVVQDVDSAIEEALHILRGSNREELCDVFVPWFAELTGRLEVVLIILEGKSWIMNGNTDPELLARPRNSDSAQHCQVKGTDSRYRVAKCRLLLRQARHLSRR